MISFWKRDALKIHSFKLFVTNYSIPYRIQLRIVEITKSRWSFGKFIIRVR